MSLQLLDDLTQPLALVPLGKQHRLQRAKAADHIRLHFTTISTDLIHFAAALPTIVRAGSRLPFACLMDPTPVEPFR
ncbi:hypothetical protein IVB45_05865 [Bradyrhizobium sp. 4]|uniref:hypothetical protein n=1 Tax=unclassified Bradyrhizobium TaxID=2631580 RepID=UPI001FF76C93|nr:MULTISPECIES: hypothetical protein [unclassified Bradyrhizobium]MCK1403682.1 hypothetical protein [Bradyrhizobium sp. 39]MCK1634627.1 hypothetical protein [Bradyrhizobium sp. 162]MCK1751419.1 hypothetical protein [Bradyrhizobium sp. 135]UPJ39009.1 hypothetical protein IVB45_05865 [Bradyrhizobium sp. 4]